MSKIWCKNIPTLHRYRDFRIGVFWFESPSLYSCKIRS